jgi:hypothetical protein
MVTVPERNATPVTPTASLAVATIWTVPATVAPVVGAVIAVTGLTVSVAAAAEGPSESPRVITATVMTDATMRRDIGFL